MTDTVPEDVMKEQAWYERFYEQLGRQYPETELVHTERQVGSRYWTVLNELQPFAVAGKRLIDIGCNDGVYTIPYCAAGGRAIGVDISRSLVERCTARAKTLNLPCSFVQGDVDSDDFLGTIGSTFDVALFSEVLEHVRNPSRALDTIRSLLNIGGCLVLTTPTPLFNGMESKWKYPMIMLAGRRLLERHVVDTRQIPDLLKYGINPSRYRHDGYYPRALTRYVEGFGFELMKGYTIGFPRRVRQALVPTNLLRLDVEIALRRVPILKLMGINSVVIFRASAR